MNKITLDTLTFIDNIKTMMEGVRHYELGSESREFTSIESGKIEGLNLVASFLIDAESKKYKSELSVEALKDLVAFSLMYEVKS